MGQKRWTKKQPKFAAIPRILEVYPWYRLDRRANNPNSSIVIRSHRGKERIWIASSRRGISGSLIYEVFTAFGVLFNEARRPESRIVQTTIGEILEVSHIPRNSDRYDKIRRAIRDLTKLDITTVNIIPDPEYNKEEIHFRIVDEAKFSYKSKRDKSATAVQITLSKLAAPIESGYRLVDAKQFFSLSRPTSRRLFRYLEASRWRGKILPEIVIPLNELQERMPLARGSEGALKRTLSPAHNELTRRGYFREPPFPFHMPDGSCHFHYKFANTPEEEYRTEKPNELTPNEILASRLVEELNDQHSKGFFLKLTRTLPHSIIEGQLLGNALERLRDGWSPDVVRKVFTAEAMKKADDLGTPIK